MAAQMIQRHGIVGRDGSFRQLGSACYRDIEANDGWFNKAATVARVMARRPGAKLIEGGIQYAAHPCAEPEIAGVVCQMIWEA